MDQDSDGLLREIVEAVKRLPVDRQRALLVLLKKGRTNGLKELLHSESELHAVDLEAIASTYEVSIRSLLRYISGGELVATKLGRKYQVTLEDLKRFLASPRLAKQASSKAIGPASETEASNH